MNNQTSLVPLKMLLFSFHGANTMVVSFLPLLLTYRGLSGQEIGFILAIGPTISIIAQPFWGFMSDKYQTMQKILIITAIGLVVSSAIFFQMTTFLLIFIFAIFFYFFQSSIGPLADSLAQRRAHMLGIPFGSIRTWGSIGFAINALLVGELIDWVGVQYLVIPYVFMASIVLIVSFRLADVEVKAKPVQLGDVRILLKNHRLLLYLLMLLLVTITHRANDNYIGLYISELGGRDSLVGWSWFMGVVSEALVFAFAGKWFRKFHPLIFMVGAALIYATRWFLYGYFTEPLGIVAFQFMHGLSFGVFYLAAFQYVSRLIPEKLQATGHLLFTTVFFGISGIVASLGGGYVLDTFGGTTLYYILGIMATTGSVLIILYHAAFSKY
ncbi:MFS transporter, PPP family, 3-phenylpropionic acid transporter [Pelagirhabdus alkalitolerans]|uniref:MFS transporter, PPP family, 3-phenylpropionic acid transporter n=1 Tax=Pelagirhabdus alkalitolerans TaxID=1612202 RepID=A0A1G6GKC3_9BACI|nr:MFS transporter [Pelagirhabdus alkalitolerans]SDB82482.1 MFS transporter, PPP family, 3-phenylpropionic acid transporter [Pelagirhabdus alkalitolerans]